MATTSVHSFLRACGAGGPLRLTVAGAGGRPLVRRTLELPFFLLHGGNGEYHLYLQLILGRVFWVNLVDSADGPAGRGPRAGWLDPDRGLHAGPHAVFLTPAQPGDTPDWSPLAPDSLGQQALPGFALELVNAARKKQPRPANHALTLVGRAAGCPLRLVGDSVADFHCSLVATPDGPWVVDLRGTDGEPGWQGVRVNGARVPWARLADGDELAVGKFLYRVHHDLHPAPRPAGPPHLPVPLNAGTSPPQTWLEERAPGQLLLAQALFVPFLRQLGLMQGQMLAQLEQALMRLVDRVEAAQRDLPARTNEQADELDRLRAEVRRLQAELEQRPAPARDEAPPVARPPAPTPAPAPVPSERAVNDWLYNRLQEFHDQQQGLWHRLLHRVLGK